MAYEDLQTKQEFIEQLYLEGKIWKLERDNYRCPGHVKNWLNAFILGFEPIEREFIRNVRILWRSDDEYKGSEWPRYGIAANIAQLKCLINDRRIHRDEIGIELEIWNEILELDTVVLRNCDNLENTSDENNEDRNSDDQESDSLIVQGHFKDFASTTETENVSLKTNISATPDHILEALDKIVTHLTGKFYNAHTDLGAKFGAYIDDYDFNIKVMTSFWDKGNAYLPNDLAKFFRSGEMLSWRGVIRELKDYFECNENQETMIDLFAELTSIAMQNCGTKNKFDRMRSKISQFFITNPEDFLTCYESDYFKIRQTTPEEFSPIVHTLLNCIIYMASPLPKSKWRDIHDDYFSLIRKFPSYKDWHENRLKFYRILDEENRPFIRGEKSGTPNLSDKCDESLNDVNRDPIVSIGSKNNNLENSSRCNQNQNMIGEIRANNQNFNPKCKISISKTKNFVNSPVSNLQSENNLLNSSSRCNVSNYIRDIPPKCTHCTKYVGKTVRHVGPYQGRGDKCLFDVNGMKKASYCVRFELEGELRNLPNLSLNQKDNKIEYTNTHDCIYVHGVFVDKSETVRNEGFGESKDRAVNKSLKIAEPNMLSGQPVNYKKVETVPSDIRNASVEHISTRDACVKNTIMFGSNVYRRDEFIENGSHRDESILKSEVFEPSMKKSQLKFEKDSCVGKSYFRKRKIDLNPTLSCTFRDVNRPNMVSFGTVTLDSGATYSMVHISKLKYCQFWKVGKRKMSVKGAGGQIIPCADFMIDIAMKIENLGIFILKNVLVSTSKANDMKDKVLLGVSDMNRLKIIMDFDRKRVKFGVGPNHEKWVNMKPLVLNQSNFIGMISLNHQFSPDKLAKHKPSMKMLASR